MKSKTALTPMALQTPKTLGQFLYKRRRKTGMSLRKVADLAGISKTYLSRLENDLCNPPSVAVINALCTWLPMTTFDVQPFVPTRPLGIVKIDNQFFEVDKRVEVQIKILRKALRDRGRPKAENDININLKLNR